MVESGVKPQDSDVCALNYCSLFPFHYHKGIEVFKCIITYILYLQIICNVHTILLTAHNFKTLLGNVYFYNLFQYLTTFTHTQTRI